MSVICTMWDRQLRLFPKDGALKHNIKNMTTSETNDRAALKLHYANKHPTSNKTFEEAYSITFTDSTSNHTNLII